MMVYRDSLNQKWNNQKPGDSKWPFHPLVGGHLTIPERSQRLARKVDWHPGWRVYLQNIHLSQFIGSLYRSDPGMPYIKTFLQATFRPSWRSEVVTFVDFWKPQGDVLPSGSIFFCWKILVAVGNLVIYLSSMYAYMYMYIYIYHVYIHIYIYIT